MVAIITAKKLREDRANLIEQARAYHRENCDENGNLASDHAQTFDRMMDDASEKLAAAKRLEALETAEAGLNQPTHEPLPTDHPMNGEQINRDGDRYAVRNYRYEHGRGQYSMVDPGRRGTHEYRKQFQQFLSGQHPQQLAALQTDDDEQAGYLVSSEQLAAGIIKTVDDLLFIRQYARVHVVRDAKSLGIRRRTSKASTFDWSSELTVSTEDSSLKYGKRVLTPHHLTGMIKVSRDLASATSMGVEQIVQEELSMDAAEKEEDGFLTGTGDQQPLGVFTASSDGISTSRDVQTGSSTDFTLDGVIDAKYSMKAQHRANARWLFHRDAIKKLAQLADSNGQPIFRVGAGLAQDGGPPEDTLLNIPVDESEKAPSTFTTGLYVGLLANWRYYEIADALNMEFQRLNELYAATNQIGFIGRMKVDGMPTLEEAFVRMITD